MTTCRTYNVIKYILIKELPGATSLQNFNLLFQTIVNEMETFYFASGLH